MGAGSPGYTDAPKLGSSACSPAAGYMGAPTVGLEKLDSDQAEIALQAALEAYLASQSGMSHSGSSSGGIGADAGGAGGAADPGAAAPGAAGSAAAETMGLPAGGLGDPSGCGTRLAAVMAGEVGGGNGIEPLVVGARLGLPVVDCDLMGRAFPELQASPSGPCQPAGVAAAAGRVGVWQRVWEEGRWGPAFAGGAPPLCAALPCPALCHAVLCLWRQRVPALSRQALDLCPSCPR